MHSTPVQVLAGALSQSTSEICTVIVHSQRQIYLRKVNLPLFFLCVGPIRKLEVPDFQHISNVYEQMQSEVLEKPSRAR